MGAGNVDLVTASRWEVGPIFPKRVDTAVPEYSGGSVDYHA
jgi:hypothetical protein